MLQASTNFELKFFQCTLGAVGEAGAWEFVCSSIKACFKAASLDFPIQLAAAVLVAKGKSKQKTSHL
jgi:hypothetical protein